MSEIKATGHLPWYFIAFLFFFFGILQNDYLRFYVGCCIDDIVVVVDDDEDDRDV